MQFDRTKRRELIALLGSAAAAWPFAVGAQQAAMPVIGVLSSTSLVGRASSLTAFQQGVRETGYVEGRNVAIEYRWLKRTNTTDCPT
jgi:putative tryptophan/tyrosine transport system substrate-binding protein